jgi:hypothetical protein
MIEAINFEDLAIDIGILHTTGKHGYQQQIQSPLGLVSCEM